MTENGETGKFALSHSPHFAGWLAGSRCSLAFTTYQAGKLFLIGAQSDGSISVFERTFARSMGLAVSGDGQVLALGTQYQVYRFDNILPAGQSSPEGYDAVYAPHVGWVTGDVDVHDVGFAENQRPVFVNTLFSCIAAVSDSHSFQPLWKPTFVSRLAPEDRCHLNGFALQGGQPRYATAVSRSDVVDGWRDRRADGGVLIDIVSNEVVVEGLSMPHSPRLYRDHLWLLNSGTGEFGYVEVQTGKFRPIAFCPGYARGLDFMGSHAVIGLSLPRENRTFSGLLLDEKLKAGASEPRCGLIVISLDTGDITAWIRIEGVVHELYDVAALPNVRRPALIGFKGDEVQYMITLEEAP